jgi:hypothetical protein
VNSSDRQVAGRSLRCVDCAEWVFVYEVPSPFLDPARFRCVFCLDPRHERAQLELVTGERSPRSEVRNYDPAQARIPY